MEVYFLFYLLRDISTPFETKQKNTQLNWKQIFEILTSMNQTNVW